MRGFHKICEFWDQGVEADCEWVENGAADVIAQLIGGNYAIWVQFRQTHPLNPRVFLNYEGYISTG